MKTIEKLIAVVKNNIGYSIALVIAIALFGIFSDGLIRGLITAASAFIAFVCAYLLYKEYNKAPAVKTASKPAPKSKKKK